MYEASSMSLRPPPSSAVPFSVTAGNAILSMDWVRPFGCTVSVAFSRIILLSPFVFPGARCMGYPDIHARHKGVVTFAGSDEGPIHEYRTCIKHDFSTCSGTNIINSYRFWFQRQAGEPRCSHRREWYRCSGPSLEPERGFSLKNDW